MKKIVILALIFISYSSIAEVFQCLDNIASSDVSINSKVKICKNANEFTIPCVDTGIINRLGEKNIKMVCSNATKYTKPCLDLTQKFRFNYKLTGKVCHNAGASTNNCITKSKKRDIDNSLIVELCENKEKIVSTTLLKENINILVKNIDKKFERINTLINNLSTKTK